MVAAVPNIRLTLGSVKSCTVRLRIIRNEIIKTICKSQSCMVSKLPIIFKRTCITDTLATAVATLRTGGFHSQPMAIAAMRACALNHRSEALCLAADPRKADIAVARVCSL